MKPPHEREGVSPGFEAAAGSRFPGRPRQRAAPAAAPRDSAVAPVHWLRGEVTLRTYRAQRDQCLQLYDRGRAAGLYGRRGSEVAADCEPDPPRAS